MRDVRNDYNTDRNSLKLANLAIDHKNDGVVGFDLAGSEKSSPAKTHSEAFKLIKKIKYRKL